MLFLPCYSQAVKPAAGKANFDPNRASERAKNAFSEAAQNYNSCARNVRTLV